METPAEDEGIVQITEMPKLQCDLFDFLMEGEPTERQKELGWLLFTALWPEPEPDAVMEVSDAN